MSENHNGKNLKGTWNQAILTFLLPIMLVLGVRWALLEPFVIPSGSMIPNLLIHDHIVVKKLSYGLRIPFMDRWLVQWSQPQRGDVVVFKYPENPDVYYIKRLIGLPGDSIVVKNGRISIEGKSFDLQAQDGDPEESSFAYFTEDNGVKKYTVRFMSAADTEAPQGFQVPEGNYFFMGDNRDQSSDSRVWGFVKNDYIVGKAWSVWLSCESTLPTMSFVCDPSQIRWNRIFKSIP